MSLSWYYNRMQAMSAEEILFRIQESVFSQWERWTKTRWQPETSLKFYPDNLFSAGTPKEFDYSSKYPIFTKTFDFHKDIMWHLDLQSGNEFPKIYSGNIDIRTDKYGNAKYVWEVNRLQFLPKLALQFKKTNNIKYLDIFCKIINSWYKENPYLIGVNWYSNIEVSIRLLNWFLCWQILETSQLIHDHPRFKKFTDTIWLPLIFLHCHYAYRYPSKYSSANNHTIAEASALFVASSFWNFDNSKYWQKASKQILEDQILNQHSKNGINKEEAAGYIQFVADFLLISYLVAEKTKNFFSPSYKETLFNILTYMNNISDNSGNYPRYGDEDDAMLFFLDGNSIENNFISVLHSGATIFNHPAFKKGQLLSDIKNNIFLGLERVSGTDSSTTQKNEENSRSIFYSDECHFLLKKSTDRDHIFIHFNAGPLGLAPMCAHGHADALSFSLQYQGYPVFVDPGTYCYHTEKKWRQYFISTLAHNTICINGENQADNGGPTLWKSQYQVTLVETQRSEERDMVVACHNGYHKFNLHHQRKITFNKNQNLLIINDTITNNSEENLVYQIPFHLHPDVKLNKVDESTFKLSIEGDNQIYLETDPKLKSEIIIGQDDPILGWFSPAFYHKVPCPVIYAQFESNESFEMETRIMMGEYQNGN